MKRQKRRTLRVALPFRNPRPYGQNRAPPQPTTPFINAAPCHGAPNRRALRIALPPQPRQPARRDT